MSGNPNAQRIPGGIYFFLKSFWKHDRTDWRMFLLSGFIDLGINGINNLFTYETDFLLQCIVGLLIVLLCERIFICRWNIVEGPGLSVVCILPDD